MHLPAFFNKVCFYKLDGLNPIADHRCVMKMEIGEVRG